jgi:dihydrodipicolinate synthase/N-acetylneuraminate lyase
MIAEMDQVTDITFPGNPGAIIAGTVGAQSTGEAIRLAQDAADAGADFILSLHPNYFPAAMTPEAIQGFFEDVSGGVRRAVWCYIPSVLCRVTSVHCP